MGVVFTFPGQGAQRAGMIAELPDSAAVRDTLAETADVLGRDVSTLDNSDALEGTETTQLALTVVGVASARHLIAEAGMPDAAMGLSIGAWPAAVIAGAIGYADALILVAARGRLMAEAYPQSYGMSAVIGLEEDRVQELAADLYSDDAPLYVGNVNSDTQIVVAGRDDALDRLAEAATAKGASRVQRLDMAVPSHCALLDVPAERLAEAASGTTFHAPACAYFSANRRRRLWQADDIRDDLVYNMARTVYWAASARIVHESGYELAVEMPPARVLTRLHPAMEGPGEAVAVIDAGWHNAAALIRRAHTSAD
ncbi:malonate decarboxylase, epsilon subunit [Salinisphaera shabanensis T35B1]|uniref:ACP S-malonyltransferase n=1 Tax=Salinisphaera shabanensis TaxID=180542 RepID=UPI003341ACE4